MANDTQSLFLSAAEVASMTGWSDAMVNDYISRGADYMLIGEDSPEGVQPANRTRQYFDTVANKLYINPVVGARTGWIML